MFEWFWQWWDGDDYEDPEGYKESAEYQDDREECGGEWE